MDGMIATLDVTLQVTADELSHQLATGTLTAPKATAFMLRQQQRLPHLAYLRAADAQGNAVYGPGVLAPPTSIADRGYFQRLRDSASATATLEHQLVLGRITGKHVWIFARRINQADGSFGGVVYSSLSSQQIMDMFSKLSLDDEGSIALRESDMTLVARYTSGMQTPVPLGDRKLSDPYARMLEQHPDAGVYVSGATSIDGISRTHAYLRSQQYGFLVNVGVGDSASLKEWRLQTYLIAGLTAAYVLALYGFAWLLCRSWSRQEAALIQMNVDAHTLRASEERFRSLFTAMSEGVALHEMVYDERGQAIDYRILDTNPAFETHTGAKREQVNNQLASQVFGTDPAPFLDSYAQVARTRQPITLEEDFAPMGKRFLIHVVSPAEHQFATIFEDITERSDMVRRLRESEARYELVTENISDVIWMVDVAARKITYISPSVLPLLGRSAQEIMSQPTEATFSQEAIDLIRDKVQQKRNETQAGDASRLVDVVDVDLRHRSGRMVHTELVMTYQLDAAGQLATFLGVTRDVSERKRLEAEQARAKQELERRLAEISALQERLQEQATRDPLTRLHNRRFMDETLPRELARAKRSGQPLAMIMVDIDHFKQVNDTYGHAAGDEVLKTLAQLLKAQTRESDVICRYGGEEFLVALSGMNVAQAVERVEHWRLSMAETVVQFGEFKISVTLSAGIAGFPDHGADVDVLLVQADKALYRSKHSGRNRVTSA